MESNVVVTAEVARSSSSITVVVIEEALIPSAKRRTICCINTSGISETCRRIMLVTILKPIEYWRM